MRVINLLIIFIVAVKCEAEGEPATESNITIENVTSTESCCESTAEAPENLVEEKSKEDSESTLPVPEPQEGPENLVGNVQSLDNSSSTIAPEIETTTESEPEEGPENLVDKDESLNYNSSTQAHETNSIPTSESSSEIQEEAENLVSTESFLNYNSSTEAADTEMTLIKYEPSEGNAIGSFSKIQLYKLPIPTKPPHRHHLRRTMIKILQGLERDLKKILEPESDEESE